MAFNITELRETLEINRSEMTNDRVATNDLIVDDLLVELGYNRKKDKNVKRLHDKSLDWEVLSDSGCRIAVKVFALGEILAQDEFDTAINASFDKRFRIFIVTNGEALTVCRYQKETGKYTEVCDIDFKKDLSEIQEKVLSAISKDTWDMDIIDSIVNSSSKSTVDIIEVLKSSVNDICDLVLSKATGIEDSDKEQYKATLVTYLNKENNISETQSNDNELRNQIDSLTAELNATKEQLNDTTNKLLAEQENTSNSTSDSDDTEKDEKIKALEAQVQELTATMVSDDGEKDVKIEELETELHRLKRKLSSTSMFTTGDEGIDTQINNYRDQINDLTIKVANYEEQVGQLEEKLKEAQNEIDNMAGVEKKRAHELLMVIEDDPNMDRHYVGVVNTELLQYDEIHTFVGRSLQKLYEVKRLEASQYIFNGDIFKLSQPAIRNDLVMNNKQYDVNFDDMYEDEVLNKLRILFSHFSDVVFECRKIGTLRDKSGLKDSVNKATAFDRNDDLNAAEEIEMMNSNDSDFSEVANDSLESTDDLSTDTFGPDDFGPDDDVSDFTEEELASDELQNDFGTEEQLDYGDESDFSTEEQADFSSEDNFDTDEIDFSSDAEADNITDDDLAEPDFNEDFDTDSESTEEIDFSSSMSEGFNQNDLGIAQEQTQSHGISLSKPHNEDEDTISDDELAQPSDNEQLNDNFNVEGMQTEDNWETSENEIEDFGEVVNPNNMTEQLLVAQLLQIDNLIWMEDVNINFKNIKYIGSNNVTFNINKDANPVSNEQLLCKCVDAIMAIESYNGNAGIISQLKETNFSNVNNFLHLYTEEYRGYPRINGTKYVPSNITTIQSVCSVLYDICNYMNISMDEIFVYLTADTDSDFIIENYGYSEDAVQLRDCSTFDMNPDNKIIAIVKGDMFNNILVTKNSLQAHKDIIVDTIAVKTKNILKQINKEEDITEAMVEMLISAAKIGNTNISAIGNVVGENYKIISDKDFEVGPEPIEVNAGGNIYYRAKFENWQLVHSLIKMYITLFGNTAIAVKLVVNVDAVNFYGQNFDSSEPALSLAVRSFADYIAANVKR